MGLTATDISFTQAADFYLKRYREGSAPPVDLFAQAFPHIADRLRLEMPSMLMLEQALGTGREPRGLKSRQVLGHCQIEEEIGRGGMGTVYRAKQIGLDRTVAIKVIALDGCAPGIVERFELERRAMARLDHPSIVPVYEYGHDDQHAFLVMKYIDGFNLFQLIEDDSPYRAKVKLAELHSDWNHLAKIGAEVASGLQHAHEQGLIHRDIKPSNLLLDEHDKVWITDFGLAKIQDFASPLSRAGDAIGTLRYMAPEQLRGFCDARSDVYSLGLTLYELAVGGPSWEMNSSKTGLPEIVPNSLTDVRSKNPCVPEDLADIIMKACSFDPLDRYQTAGELMIVLNRYLFGIRGASDRRKRRRLSDNEFRRRTLRTRIAMGAGILLAGAFTIEVYRGTGPIASEPEPVAVNSIQLPEPERPVPAQITFLEKLADDPEEDMVNIVADFVKDSVDDATQELSMSGHSKEELIHRIDQFAETVKEKGLTGREMDSILDSYRASTLPMATKVMRLHSVLERSHLDPQEKQKASFMLRKMAGCVVKRLLSVEEAKRMVNALTHNRNYSSEELLTFNAPDRMLQKWFAAVEQRMNLIPNELLRDFSIQKEVQDLFDAAMKDIESNTQSSPEASP